MSELEYTEQGWRMTVDTNRHHRDSRWDYHGEGVYHITLVVENRYPLFGKLAGTSPENAHIELNEFGKKVDKIVRKVPEFYATKNIWLKTLQVLVMPDHIHWAIQVLQPMNCSIGEVVRSTKSACTSLYKNSYAYPGGNNAAKDNTCDAESVDFARIFTSRGSIWQYLPAGYHERLLRCRGQLDAMIHYIKDNPRRLWLKRANPDLFRIHRQTPIAGIPCTTLGNIFLAENPLREALHCSRTLTKAEIDQLKAECLMQAANGTIFISPAVSEGEKQICRTLREAGYPLIIVLSEGFPKPDSPHYKYYKPSGVYFEACSAGRLLLIEPDAALFERKDIETAVYAKTGPIPHETKRYRFVAQNAIAELISK
ncbi:MAG: hypothetical protein IK073_02835 [Paludibacteraceae bacterium]|nr:hypothetical protein [Paludibacteraceae bacterium]